jgi:hypothetical protein
MNIIPYAYGSDLIDTIILKGDKRDHIRLPVDDFPDKGKAKPEDGFFDLIFPV